MARGVSFNLNDLWWNTMELKPVVVLNNDRLEVMMQRASGHPSLEKPNSRSQSGPSKGMEDWDFGTLPFIWVDG